MVGGARSPATCRVDLTHCAQPDNTTTIIVPRSCRRPPGSAIFINVWLDHNRRSDFHGLEARATRPLRYCDFSRRSIMLRIMLRI